MKSKISILVLFLTTSICFSQIETRRQIRGQVVNDSVSVNNVVVFNVNSNTGTVTGDEGFFKIDVRVNDTLVFSGLQFKSKKFIYSDSKGNLKIKLETFFYPLSEVVILKDGAIKPIQGSKTIIDQKYFDDEKSSPKNKTMMQVGGVENPMNFVRMYKDLEKISSKDTPKKSKISTHTDFTEVTMRKIPYSFFHKTLNVVDDEIQLFLVFCENDAKAKTVLKSNSEFELMNFLIDKNIEFKKITNLDK